MENDVFRWIQVNNTTVINLSIVSYFEKLDVPELQGKINYSIYFNLPDHGVQKIFSKMSDRDDFFEALKEHLDVLT